MSGAVGPAAAPPAPQLTLRIDRHPMGFDVVAAPENGKSVVLARCRTFRIAKALFDALSRSDVQAQ